MKLRFAFAVNMDGQFRNKHFGDADKYIIYEIGDSVLEFVSEENNPFKELDKKPNHGSVKKGKAIIGFLKNKNVNGLVSRRFGTNIKLINEHFIPIEISLKYPQEAIDVLNKHLHWIIDEWENKESGYNLFTIKKGILKSPVIK
jgi:predicted Fe-Mo cluster-binding NifX family protein